MSDPAAFVEMFGQRVIALADDPPNLRDLSWTLPAVRWAAETVDPETLARWYAEATRGDPLWSVVAMMIDVMDQAVVDLHPWLIEHDERLDAIAAENQHLLDIDRALDAAAGLEPRKYQRPLYRQWS